MKTVICLALTLASQLSASSPDSLAGMVFRQYTRLSGIANATETTIVLNVDSSYFYLKTAVGVRQTQMISSLTGLPSAHWGAMGVPGQSGSYQYTKTGETTGSLTMTHNGIASNPSTLYFSSATTGSTSPTGLNELGGDAFYVTALMPGGSSPALANVSSRGMVTSGHALSVGFVIPGTTEREVLIRVIGPALTAFGVTGSWLNPQLQIYQGNSAIFGDTFTFPPWSDAPADAVFAMHGVASPEMGLNYIFNYLGAFPLTSGSKDIAIVIRLAPGAYSAVASAPAGDTGGEALLEYYLLP